MATSTNNNTTNSNNTTNNITSNNTPNNTTNTKWLEERKGGFLLDVYGVAYNCGQQFSLIPGSKEAIDLLRKAGVPFRFCSNTSTKTPYKVWEDMQQFGFDVHPEEIFTPVPVIKAFLLKHNLRPFLLVDPEVDDYFSDIEQQRPNCVVLADAKDRFSYDNMNKAFRVLSAHPDNTLITLGTGKYYKETEGMFLDCGTFAAALEYATNKKAYCIGKPSKEYFQTALDSMQICPRMAVMVGDDIVGDVEGAQKADIWALQVRTGKFRASDEPHAWVSPHAYVDNLLQAVTLYLSKHHPECLL